MPVMDGMDATQLIRKLPGGQEVKIVAVTASAFLEQRNETLAAGMDDFIRKPYRFDEVYECLAKQLGARYIYKNSAIQEPEPLHLTPAMLAPLPKALRNELKNAVESLESERIATIIEQTAEYDEQLQKVLTHLTNNYDYPAILKALLEIQ